MDTHAERSSNVPPTRMAPGAARISRILVGVDFSPVSELALVRALTVAEQLGASVFVCHVVPLPPPMFEVALGVMPAGLDLEESVEIARVATADLIARHTTAKVEMTPVLRRGDAATEIAAAARDVDADLVVVGTRARTGVARVFLGDVAAAVVRSTDLPVMLLHDPGLPHRRG